MLILTFRENQEAVISIGGEEVRVQYVGQRGGKSKEAVLGFTAPRTVVIDRLCVHEAKLADAEKRASPVAAPDEGDDR